MILLWLTMKRIVFVAILLNHFSTWPVWTACPPPVLRACAALWANCRLRQMRRVEGGLYFGGLEGGINWKQINNTLQKRRSFHFDLIQYLRWLFAQKELCILLILRWIWTDKCFSRLCLFTEHFHLPLLKYSKQNNQRWWMWKEWNIKR